MKLVIKREKKSGFSGKSKYGLYVRADISEEEKTLIKENSLGKTLVVYHNKTGLGAFADFSFWSALWRMFFDTAMTVDTFVRGTTFKCKDVMELTASRTRRVGRRLCCAPFSKWLRPSAGKKSSTWIKPSRPSSTPKNLARSQATDLDGRQLSGIF